MLEKVKNAFVDIFTKKIWKKKYIYLLIVLFILVFLNKTLDYMDNCNVTLKDPGYIENPTDNLIAEGFNIRYLYRGEYVFTIVGTSEGKKNYCEIIDRYTDTYLGGGIYNEGEGNTSFYVVVPDRCRDVVVKSYSVDGELIINECFISANGVYSDKTWLLFLCIPLFVIFVMAIYQYKNNNSKLLLLTLFACLASLPFLTENLQNGHDISFHFTRFCGLVEGLREGQFPVRIDTAFLNGAGYIEPMMYPCILLYPFALMASHSASLLFSFKSIYVVFTFLTIYISYYSYKEIMDNDDNAAFIFAVVYTLNPYRLNDIYIRCALGEWLAMTFIPLLVAGLYQLLIKSSKKGFIYSTIAATMIFQSHMITTFLVAIFGGVVSFLYIICNMKKFFKVKRVIYVVFTALFTVLLNVWYLYSFLNLSKEKLAIISGDENLFFDNCLYLFEVFMDGTVNYQDTSVRGTVTQGQMSLGIGIFLLITTAIYIYTRFIKNNNYYSSQIKVKADLLCLISLCAIFMESVYFPWVVYKDSPITQLFIKIQYPWRLQMIIVLCLTLISAVVLSNIKRKEISAILILLLIITATGYSRDYLYINDAYKENKLEGANEEVNSGSMDYIKSKYLPYFFIIKDICLYNDIPVSDNDEIEITDINRAGSKYSCSVVNSTNEDVTLVVPIFYTGFYKAYINGSETEIFEDDQYGFSKIVIDGSYKECTILLQYFEPLKYVISDIISLVTAIIFIIYLLYVLYKVVKDKRFASQKTNIITVKGN